MVAQIGRQDRRESSEQNRGILCVERVLLFLLQERRLLSYCRRCLTWQGRIQRGGGAVVWETHSNSSSPYQVTGKASWVIVRVRMLNVSLDSHPVL